MAISNAVTNSFRKDLLQGLHNFTTSTGNAFKMALYTNLANLDATVASWAAGTPANEHAATGTYVQGGKALVIETASPGGTTGAVWGDFVDLTWAASTITAAGALIYNTTSSNKSVVTLTFGGDKISSAGDFTVQFPPADASNAIIRIA